MQVLLSPLQDHLGVSAALATGRVGCGNSKVEAKEAKQKNQILPKSLFDGHATSLSGGGGGGSPPPPPQPRRGGVGGGAVKL